jgi:hypothetical protein
MLNAEVKKAWSYTSIPLCVFMMWCLVKHRDNFTFTFYSKEVPGWGLEATTASSQILSSSLYTNTVKRWCKKNDSTHVLREDNAAFCIWSRVNF